ncbi:alpha/beta hydrolase [Variovorax sp. VNK109]|uniref:alpha/beta hydrolase n=1 Tax=Variovorax sp. VNK109 TaxID=3400919 RepID=UPI003C0F78F3
MTLYREFTTQAQLDAQYDPSSQVADPAAMLARRQAAAAHARATLDCDLSVRYGELPPETLDVFPAAQPGSPVVVFIHGGYWSTPFLVKELYSWVAMGLHARGFTTVVLDYGVCPDYSVAELTAQCRRAVAWLYRNAERYNGSNDKIYVTGHSAGGHLSARVAQTDWTLDFALPMDVVKGACPISGLFDLRPFPYTWLQPKLRLTPEMAFDESPLLVTRRPLAPMLIAWGADETSEFARQAQAWKDCCEANETLAELLPLPGALHNSAIDGFASADSLLCESIASHMRVCLPG